MSNTVIQIKRSTTTAAPVTLSIAEQAYSYSSDKLFIGNVAGNGVIAIGGGYYVNAAINAYNTANNAVSAGMPYANSVGAAGNAYALATATSIGTAGNNYSVAIGTSSNAYSLATATSVGTAGNNYTNAVGAAGNAYALQTATDVGAGANAYATATFYAKTGGQISGDVSISGNLTISGMTTYANTQTLNIGDNIFTLNADIPGDVAPVDNAGMEVKRGTQATTALIWDEGLTAWSFTNNGTNYYKIASNAQIDAVNAYSTAVGTSSNNYSAALAAAGNAYALQTATDIGTAGNNYTNAVTTAGNNYSVAIGAAGNAYALSVATSIGTAGNNYAVAIGTSGNAYALATATSIGTAGNNYTVAVGASSNAYATAIGAVANTNAANASYLTQGLVNVLVGGTGRSYIQPNGVLYGNGSDQILNTSAGTEGQVLQASATGVPQFGMLDGGTF